jgi:hypothetical protein
LRKRSSHWRGQGLNAFSLARCVGFAAAPLLICFVFGFSLPANLLAQAGSAQEKADAAVRAQMHNVKYRFTDNIAVQIHWLTGALVPVGNNELPIFDDKNSFRLRIDSGEIAISPADLANLLNSYVFARPNSPLSGISVAVANGRLKLKGELHDKGDIPFESEGVLTPTPDGRLRLHSDKVKALHVPVKGLMDAFGIGVSDFIKSGKVPGVQSEKNDLILDLEQILPPPHIEGKVTTVRVEGNSVLQIFGGAGTAPPKLQNASYMSYRGNRLRFGRLTMDDADMVLYDLDPADPLDFFLDHYKEQVAAGYSKITTNDQLRIYVKDFAKLKSQPKSPAKTKEN